MQRYAFIRDLGLKPFALKAGDPETTCPSHSLCSQLSINSSVGEGDPKGYGKKEGL